MNTANLINLAKFYGWGLNNMTSLPANSFNMSATLATIELKRDLSYSKILQHAPCLEAYALKLFGWDNSDYSFVGEEYCIYHFIRRVFDISLGSDNYLFLFSSKFAEYDNTALGALTRVKFIVNNGSAPVVHLNDMRQMLASYQGICTSSPKGSQLTLC